MHKVLEFTELESPKGDSPMESGDEPSTIHGSVQHAGGQSSGEERAVLYVRAPSRSDKLEGEERGGGCFYA